MHAEHYMYTLKSMRFGTTVSKSAIFYEQKCQLMSSGRLLQAKCTAPHHTTSPLDLVLIRQHQRRALNWGWRRKAQLACIVMGIRQKPVDH